jgi:CheY-like chemotaxis protein
VLLVDDDELIQSTMQGVLSALGHTFQAAWSGEGALAILQGGFEPEVIILDVNMPGMGGAGALRHLRALCPLVPVLLATGQVDQVVHDLARAYPLVSLLPKPFSMKELQARLDRLDLP